MFNALLQELPAEVAQLARQHKAFQRARKIKTPAQLLRMVLLYGGLDKSWREVAGEMTLLVARLTDSSVQERLAACGPWLQALLADLLQASTLPPSLAGWRLLVIDGSSIEAPGATGTDYRLHVCLEVTHVQFVHLLCTEKHTGESLAHFPLGPGDLVLADRHYATAEAIVDAVRRQVTLVLRMSAQRLPVYAPDGTRLDLATMLGEQARETIRSWAVQVQSSRHQQHVEGYVHAYRLNEEAANRARQRVREHSKKKGHTPKATTLLLAEWVFVFTTVPPETVSAQAVMALYRVRWQVELAIKRWKSLLDVDALRARAGSTLAAVWLSAKLLYAVLIERRAQRKVGNQWMRLDGERSVTWWRVWKLIKNEVDECIVGVQGRQAVAWRACVEMLAERPRRRKLQRLPEEVVMHNQGIPEASQDEIPQAA
jgi:hypothetical protein